MKKNRIVAILLLVFVLAVSVVLAACEMDNIDTLAHTCTSKCSECGKCTNATCEEDACKDKCPGHHCKHVCPDCGGCLDDTCENPVCKNNRCICDSLIDSAKNYIDAMYKDLTTTDRDFELVTSAYIKKTDVTIKWSIEVAEGKTAPVTIQVVNGKTMAVISTEESEEARPYTLVAEITAGTDKVTVKYQLTVPIVDVMRNNFYKDVATDVSEGKEYYIGMYQKNAKKVLYFAGEMSDRWFGTIQDIDAATVVKLVKDGEGYRIQFVAKDGKTKYIEIVTYDEKGSTKVGMYEDGDAEVVPGKCIWKFDKTTLTLTTKVGTATYFLGAYSKNETIGRSDADQYLKVSNIDVTQFPIRLIEKKAEVERNDQEKAQYEIDKLSFATEINVAGEVDLNTAGTKYTDVAISWTSDNETIAKVEGGKVTFTLPEEETTVKLTATATINGKTATKDFNVVVKPLEPISIKEFLSKQKNDTTTYLVEAWVVAANGSDKSAGAVVLRDATGAVYCNDKMAVNVGDKVRVLAKRSDYNGTPQLSAISFTSVTLAEGETMPTWEPTEMDVSDGDMTAYTADKLIEIQATYLKITGASLIKGTDGYVNGYVNDTKVIQVYANSALKEGFDALLGKEVILYGYVRGGSAGKFVTIQLVKIETKALTPEQVLAAATEALTAPLATIGEAGKNYTLPSTVEGYTGVSIKWSVETNTLGVTVANNVLTITALPDEQGTITLVAQLSIGGTTDPATSTKNFTVTVSAKTVTDEEKVNAEIADLLAKTLDDITEAGTYDLMPTQGKTYESVKFDSWTIAGNPTFATIIEGKLVITELPENETELTLNGRVYLGETSKTVQLKVTVAAKEKELTQEEIVEAVWKLAVGASLGDYTLTGKITKIDTPYDTGYKNITVTIVVGTLTDKPIQCFRMKGTDADKLAVNDVITVTGTLKNYKGTKEFDAGCTFKDRVIGTSKITITAENATVTPATESALNGTELALTIKANDGYQIDSVIANNAAVTGNNDVYTITVSGDMNIVVTTSKAGTVIKLPVTGDFTAGAKNAQVSVAGWLNNSSSSGTYGKLSSESKFYSSFRKNDESVTSCTFEAQTSVDVTIHWYLNNTSTSGNKSSKLKFEALDADGKVVDTVTSEELNGTEIQKPADLTVTLKGEGIVKVRITMVKDGGGNIGFSTITIATTKTTEE